MKGASEAHAARASRLVRPRRQRMSWATLLLAFVAMIGCGEEGAVLVPSGAGSAATSPGTTGTTGAPVVTPGASTRRVNMRWRPSPSPGITRYDLFVGRSPGIYDAMYQFEAPNINVFSNGVNSIHVTLEREVDYYMAVRAYDGSRVSVLSNEVFLAAESGGGSGAGASASTASASSSSSSAAQSGGGATSAGSSASAANLPAVASAPASSSSAEAAATGEAASPASSTVLGSVASLSSIEIDGQYLGSDSPRPLGAAGPISISMWVRPFLDYSARRVLFEVEPVPGEALDHVSLAVLDGQDLELAVHDGAGVQTYRALFELAPVSDVWQHLAVVFDPAVDLEPRVYLDLGPCTLLQSDWNGWAFGLPNAEGYVRLGGSPTPGATGYAGRIGHTAIWADALTRSELSDIHARGHQIDLRVPAGRYESFGELVHYWRLGEDPGAIGFDLGTSDAPIDLDDPAGGVGPAQIVMDGPESLLDSTSGL